MLDTPYSIRLTLTAVRSVYSTSVENVLQISSFLTNKANSPNVQMNTSLFITMIYTIFNSLTKVKNKANSNPIQTQTNPILANYKAWQSQTKPIQSRSKPITNGGIPGSTNYI
jgi:hypothetical protein